MITNFKKIVLQNNKLLKAFGVLSQIWFVLCFRRRTKGSTNKLDINSTVVLRGGYISIVGTNNILCISEKCRLKNLRVEIFGDNNRIEIGESVMFYEKGWLCIEGDDCSISINSKTTIGSADIFCGESKTDIVIGSDCMFSREIWMNTSDFHSIIEQNTGKRINPPRNITIGEHVWVGNGVLILKGATIGSNSVIASKAVVSGKVYEENIILAGLPARVIKENINWSREKIS